MPNIQINTQSKEGEIMQEESCTFIICMYTQMDSYSDTLRALEDSNGIARVDMLIKSLGKVCL